MKDTKEAQKVYDNLAKFYHNKRVNQKNVNDFIEQPTSLSLLGNVKSKKILDAGCGSGITAKKLAKKGAKVFGLDISKEMLNLAKDNCKGFNIKFKKGGINKLPYKNKSFDKILCSLTIHYLKNPEKAFKEFNRVLKKNGNLIFSTNSPFFVATKQVKEEKGKNILCVSDYFNQKKYYWNIYGSEIKIPSYPLNFEEMFDMFYKNNFIVKKFKEPFMKKTEKRIPKHLNKWCEIPTFIVIKLKKIK